MTEPAKSDHDLLIEIRTLLTGVVGTVGDHTVDIDHLEAGQEAHGTRLAVLETTVATLPRQAITWQQLGAVLGSLTAVMGVVLYVIMVMK